MKKNNFLYPPGGLLIWIIVTLELLTFAMGIIAYLYFQKDEPEVFLQAKKINNSLFGAINTIVLLSSGYFIASGIEKLKNNETAINKIRLGWLLGILFIVIKSVEYYQKIQGGHTIETNTYFTFYYLLTGFHLAHVLIGVGIFSYFLIQMSKPDRTFKLEDLEASGIFWHMCDLIWLFIFPTLYFNF